MAPKRSGEDAWTVSEILEPQSRNVTTGTTIRAGGAGALEMPVLRDVQVYCAGKRQAERNERRRDVISCSDARGNARWEIEESLSRVSAHLGPLDKR
jgi:hypothetical protein